VEKLRITVLFKVDFNTNNKWIRRAVMYMVEKLKALMLEQYGSQKSKAANIQSLNKCLFYNMCRFKRQMTALCSNNAKSCYDQIVLLIAQMNVPLSTSWNASASIPHPNIDLSSSLRNGVSFACVNCQPASSRHALSNCATPSVIIRAECQAILGL